MCDAISVFCDCVNKIIIKKTNRCEILFLQNDEQPKVFSAGFYYSSNKQPVANRTLTILIFIDYKRSLTIWLWKRVHHANKTGALKCI